MEQAAAVRNLEQIQEQDGTTSMPRALSLGLIALGVACVVFAIVAVGGRKTGTSEKRPDPLGDLVAQHAKGVAPNAPTAAAMVTQLSAKDVTFPSILSDDARPTTALAAVRANANAGANANANGSGNANANGSANGNGNAFAGSPPPPSDRLPVVTFAGGTPPVPHDDSTSPPPAGAKQSLPAQNVLEASPIVTRPRDPMTKSASEAGDVNTPSAALAPTGHEGGWQLQVSSFKTQSEAEQFAEQLRARGHKAYTLEARVTGRGTWWRVRVGPFASLHSAQAYRATFEAKEHVVPFVVTPEKSDKK